MSSDPAPTHQGRSARRHRRNAGLGIAACVLVGAIAGWLLARSGSDRPPAPVPNARLAWTLDTLHAVLALALLGVVVFLTSAAWRRWRHGRWPAVPRPTGWDLLISQSVFAALLGWLLLTAPDARAAIGFKGEWPLSASIALGLVAYAGVLLADAALRAVTGSLLPSRAEELRLLRRLLPPPGSGRVAFIVAVCLINPVTEEILYRGVLVHLLRDELVLSLPATVVLALGASVVAHLYQGVRFVPFHLLFHGTALAIALSPAGLAGCIALHAAGDLWPFLQAKRDGGSRSPRERRRA